ncbi:MAG TPA: NADPH:quinone reductase [Planctomicrobium sp.]|nr:NADPH:quinone reductase [Planctomicrobium sp.]
MKCAYVTQPGPADSFVIGERPDPVAGPGQALVRIHVASVNPIDTYIRAGAIPMPVDFPFIPGCDLAGEVIAVGPNASRFKVGDRVWGSNQGLFQRQGTLAELAAVNEDWLYPTPDSVSDEDAVAGSLTGITAHLGLFRDARLKSGDWLFVNGGTGGVGSAVVQFARIAGAKIIATAGSEEKRNLAKALGADVVLDYRSPTLDEEIKAATGENNGVDLYWETQREPNLQRIIGLMKKGGRIVLMAGRQAELTFNLGSFYTNDLRLYGFAMFNASPAEQRASAEEMNLWATQGKWKPLIGARFPLDQAAAAHQLQEDNTLGGKSTLTGKILVNITGK